MKSSRAASVVLIATTTLVAGCEERPGEPDKPTVTGSAAPEALPDRDGQLAKKLVADGAVLLDVRTRAEFDSKHLPGALHIPVGSLGSRLSEVERAAGDKSKPIIVYCASGARSARAKQMLLKAGYRRVMNLGGIDDWPGS